MIPHGYKETKIGRIPEAWEVKALGSIADVKGGKRLPKGEKLIDEKTAYPYIRVTDFKNMGVDKKKIKYLTPKIAEKITRYKISKEDVYISIAGTIGIAGIIPDELDGSNLTENACKITGLNGLDKYYLSYFLNSFFAQKQIKSFTGIVSQPKLALYRIEKILLPVPGIFEQQKIAEILSTVDEAIENSDAIIKETQQLKKGLMQKLFTEGIGHKRFKKTKIGRVPEEWEIQRLDYYLDLITYGFTNPMPVSNIGPLMITALNINKGRVLYDDCRRTTKEAYTTLLTDKSRPKLNDILLTKDGTLGRVAIMEKANCCINQSVALMRPNNRAIPLFLKYLLEGPYYQKRMLLDAGGSTIKHIYISIVNKMKIAMPETTEQQKIVEMLSEIDSKIENEQNNKAELEQLKRGLMQVLLTGKIRVRV